ncbi:MAG: hypothetical protein K9L30_12655 [Desulfobacterales bacterium]|nr:hypothetical protein [Desulfobacterales bacterium]
MAKASRQGFSNICSMIEKNGLDYALRKSKALYLSEEESHLKERHNMNRALGKLGIDFRVIEKNVSDGSQ